MLYPFKEEVGGKEGRKQEAGRRDGRKEGRGEKHCFNHFTSTGFKPANVTKITFTFKETYLKLSLGSLMHGI